MVATKLMTANDLAELDEDVRVELIEGELVEMTPTRPKHGVFTTRMFGLLWDYTKTRSDLYVSSGDAGFSLQRSPDTVLVPDIAIVTDEQHRVMLTTEDAFAPFAPVIAIEVRSPSERTTQVKRKTALYLSAGVREVWWIWPEKGQITLYRQDAAPRTIEGDAVLESPELPGFRLPLGELF